MRRLHGSLDSLMNDFQRAATPRQRCTPAVKRTRLRMAAAGSPVSGTSRPPAVAPSYGTRESGRRPDIDSVLDGGTRARRSSARTSCAVPQRERPSAVIWQNPSSYSRCGAGRERESETEGQYTTGLLATPTYLGLERTYTVRITGGPPSSPIMVVTTSVSPRICRRTVIGQVERRAVDRIWGKHPARRREGSSAGIREVPEIVQARLQVSVVAENDLPSGELQVGARRPLPSHQFVAGNDVGSGRANAVIVAGCAPVTETVTVFWPMLDRASNRRNWRGHRRP